MWMLQFGLRHEVYEKQTKVRLRKKCRKTEKKLVKYLQIKNNVVPLQPQSRNKDC